MHNEELLVRIAWEYFINETNQTDIANHFRISKPTVSRLVREAKQRGLVQITINSKYGLCIELEKEFEQRFGVKASIVPAGINQDNAFDAVARAAAEYLDTIINDVHCIAVGWGRTISRIPYYVRGGTARDMGQHLEIVEMVGNFLSTSSSLHALRLAGNLARAYGATVSVLSAPALAEDKGMYMQLMSHTQIDSVLAKARQADLAIASLGSVDKDSTMYGLGLMTFEELSNIEKLGAAGEVLGRFFDEQGNIIHTSLDERLIGLSIDDVKRIPSVILVGIGQHKAKAIYGAVQGKIVDRLITDDRTAKAILDIYK